MKIIRLLNMRFGMMYPLAFLLLRLCLLYIMASVFFMYIFLDTRTQLELARISFYVDHITECIAYALLISFGGSFLLDLASIT